MDEVTRRTWDAVREFALQLPSATEDFPWGESVIKVEKRTSDPPPWRKHLVHGPMFLWLGRRDAPTPAIAANLTASFDQAIALAGATPTTMSGLGQWGWLTVRLGATDVDVELVCDWVEESYRNKAPRKLVAELDVRARSAAGAPLDGTMDRCGIASAGETPRPN